MLTLLTFDLCVCFQLSLETLYQHCDFDENKALDVIYSSVKIAQEACLEVKRYQSFRLNMSPCNQRRTMPKANIGCVLNMKS